MRSFYQKAAVVLSVAALLTGCAKESVTEPGETGCLRKKDRI